MHHSTRTQPDRNAQLVKLARQGCAGSFEALVREFQLPLRAFLIGKIGDAAAADDLAQEVLLAAFKGVDRLNEERSFRSWLFTVARNKAVDHLRAKSRKKESTSGSLDQLLAQPQLELFPNNAMVLVTLRECMKRLQPKALAIVNSFYFDDKTSEEIAAELKTKSSAVRMALLRTRKNLANCIRANATGEFNE